MLAVGPESSRNSPARRPFASGRAERRRSAGVREKRDAGKSSDHILTGRSFARARARSIASDDRFYALAREETDRRRALRTNGRAARLHPARRGQARPRRAAHFTPLGRRGRAGQSGAPDDATAGQSRGRR